MPRFCVLARCLRTSARLSQSALAGAAGLSPSTVRGWEAGRSEPSLPELTRWGRALDLPDDLLAAVRATLYAPRAWADRPGIGIGPYLRERRLATAVTLSRAATDLKLPLATLGHYESGRVEVPVGVISAIVERFAVEPIERAALCDGTPAFLEWCDTMVADLDRAESALATAAWAVTPFEILDRGPAFVRLRTGFLRARLKGDPWRDLDTRIAAAHALWLAVGERRPEAAAALAGLPPMEPADASPAAVTTLVARRYLGRARAEELLRLAEDASPSGGAWLRSEAALDLCERRRGPEARDLIERAKGDAEATGSWSELWCRRRDAVRVLLRLRDWEIAAEELDAMAALEAPSLGPDNWFARQRTVLRTRLEASEATARPAGA